MQSIAVAAACSQLILAAQQRHAANSQHIDRIAPATLKPTTPPPLSMWMLLTVTQMLTSCCRGSWKN
eukprot:6114569-Prymnesium_polylepis.2